MSKDEIPKEVSIRNGQMQKVLDDIKDTAEANKGISIVFHDVRPTGAPAHAGTHAQAHITQEELELILKTLKEEGYAYETFEKVCNYGLDPFDKPDGLM